MMATLSGLVLGITAAAAVTVFYGDSLNQILREQLPQRDAPTRAAATKQPLQSAAKTGIGVQSTTKTTTIKQQAAAKSSAKPSAKPSAKSATQLSVLSSVQPSVRPADAQLAQKWSDFASTAKDLKPVGAFRWRECFQRAAATYGVPESLLLAVASGESGFDPAARSKADAVGLMQIRWPLTSRHLGITREADLYDPCTNVSAGARYLAELAQRYNSDLHRTVAAYNYGPGRIDQGPLPQGAQWYSQYIYQHLQQVLGRPHASSSSLLPAAEQDNAGYRVLMSFNQPYRARDFMAFIAAQEPGLTLAQRSEALGRYEVIALYQNEADRQRALEAIARTGLASPD